MTLRSNVEIESEFPWMRPQPNGIDLVLAFVVDPGVDQILGEHAAFEQKAMILFQSIEDDVQGAGKLLDLRRLFGLELVQINIHRLARIDLVPNAVEAGHQACGK